MNRTEETPLLDMYIACNLELPWPCVEVRRWNDIEPNSVQRMFARGVIFRVSKRRLSVLSGPVFE